MQWEQVPGEPSGPGDQMRELAGFIRAHLGRGPALLWTDYEPPVGSDPAPQEVATALAHALRPLLDRTVRITSSAPGRERGQGGQPRPAGHDVLLLQRRAASDVLLAQPSNPGYRSTAMRLRGGQCLLLPRQWSYTLDRRPAVRPVVLHLSPGDSDIPVRRRPR
ncbi:hypothetical protein OIB37_17015 [Streptomyces sp. NBC_00820]|uniref:hypothetical protein n=1 Tax=Streptomyces sp. NBC_00820 TaxID=2975842 RepID=UPI002ED6BB5C|nr:hypothetical protein OIB37_17015 [Streptomyces sp. NBC_00820]